MAETFPVWCAHACDVARPTKDSVCSKKILMGPSSPHGAKRNAGGRPRITALRAFIRATASAQCQRVQREVSLRIGPHRGGRPARLRRKRLERLDRVLVAALGVDGLADRKRT